MADRDIVEEEEGVELILVMEAQMASLVNMAQGLMTTTTAKLVRVVDLMSQPFQWTISP